MVSHIFPLEDCMKAFETVLDPKAGSIKVIVSCCLSARGNLMGGAIQQIEP
jgi:hypothetical protein